MQFVEENDIFENMSMKEENLIKAETRFFLIFISDFSLSSFFTLCVLQESVYAMI